MESTVIAANTRYIFSFLTIYLYFNQRLILSTLAAPLAERNPRSPQFEFQHNPDGSVSGSMAFSNAIDAPGMSNAFSTANTFRIGPDGASFSNSNSNSLNSDFGGFSNANAVSSSFGPREFGSSFANANAASFSNPLNPGSSGLSFANAQANSIGNSNSIAAAFAGNSRSNPSSFNSPNSRPFSRPFDQRQNFNNGNSIRFK